MRSESVSWVVRGAGLAIGVGAVLIVATMASLARDVLLLVFLAILFGAALQPVVTAIRNRTGIGRGLSILIVYAGFLLAVVGISVFIVPTAMVQLSAALGHLPAFLEEVRAWSQRLQPEALAEGIGSLISAVQAPFRPGPPPDPDDVVEVSIVVFEVAAAIITLLALVFFWLTERARLQRYVLAFLPQGRRAGIRDAWNEVETRLGLWARGQLILMSTIGVATGIAYSAIGLPAALLLALIAAITEAIPIVGPLIGVIPAILVATTMGPETVLITVAVYLLIHLVEGNILVPLVMRNSVGISPFLVLVSLLIGATVGGILGAIVAVPVAAGITVVLQRLQARETPVPIDPAANHGGDQEPAEAPPVPETSAPRRRVRKPAARAAGEAKPRRPAGPPRVTRARGPSAPPA